MYLLAWYCFLIMVITVVSGVCKESNKANVRLATIILYVPLIIFFGIYLF